MLVFDGIYDCQLALQWLNPQLVERIAIHKGAVKIGHFLLVAAGLEIFALRHFFNNGFDIVTGFFPEVIECACAGAICRDLCVLDPAAVDIGIEVILRTNRLVKVGKFNPRAQGLADGGGSCGFGDFRLFGCFSLGLSRFVITGR